MISKLEFVDTLLVWYDHSKRILPWRDNPNPYHVWVSEIMLQQTRVETVIPFFNRFIETLPTVYDLASVDDDKLNKLWEGLGYYSRVRNLKKAAIQIVEQYDGNIPQNQSALESLSGIGSYTSGAILSIAFDQPYTAVDGNVLRVFARITANKNNIKDKHTKDTIKSIVQELLPKKRIGDFNQALMEIGATVCKPNGRPDCMICPLQEFCQAFKQNLTEDIPIKQIKVQRKIESRTVFIIQYQNRFLIEQRPTSGLLAGLYQFPNVIGHLTEKEVKVMYPNTVITKLPKSKHIFSHLEWHMKAYLIKSTDEPQGLLVTPTEINEIYSIPTAFKKYKNVVLGGLL